MAKSRAAVATKSSLKPRRTNVPRPETKLTAAAKPPPKQKFTVSHYAEADFRSEGLRTYARYRDLGISQATSGMVQAHVIRFIPPCRPEEVSKLHYHDVDFQMIYVLKGWIKSRFEGHGEIIIRAGGCWLQPPRIKHAVLDYSDDCEVLEIILPAEFETKMLE